MQFQTRCLDLMCGGGLTDAKELSEPSEKLPSPMTVEESEGKTAATKSSVSLEVEGSVTAATVLIWELEDDFAL